MKMIRVWRYKKTVQKWRWCYTSCLVRVSETLHITTFHDLRNIANFASEHLDSQTWVRFFLGIDGYSFPDGSINTSTMLNTSWGWAHFGTVLQCTLNCIFPNHFERTLLLCLEASIVTLIHSTGLAGLFYDSLFCLTLFLYTQYFPFIVIKLFLSNSDCMCYKKDLS